MSQILKWSGVVALLILVIMGISMWLGSSTQSGTGTAVDCSSTTCFTTVGILTSLQVDGTTIYNGLVSFLSSFKVGSSGSTFTKFIGTTCNLIGSDSSMNASSSKAFDCAVTGVTSSDTAFAQLSTTTTAGTAACPGWAIMGAKASTTAGFVTVILANQTCVSQSPSVSGVGSSTKIWGFQ